MSELDFALKVVQAAFYVVGMAVAILTYRSAKRGLLNTVNTEYRKRVIERLQSLSDELLAEFDPTSETYWAKNDPVKEVIDEINKEFLENKEAIVKEGQFRGGYLVSSDYERLDRFLSKVKSDPFLPQSIRDKVVDLLEARVETLSDAHEQVISSYMEALAQGRHNDRIDENVHWVHNEINSICYQRGCGISQIEDEVHKIRLHIQAYFESFDPLR